MAVRLDLSRLRCFVAVAEELSFTKAAERLRVAQPWVSSQIRRLEQDLGIELFVRSTRRVELTAQAQSLLPAVHGLLAAEDRTAATIEVLARTDHDTIELGAPSHLAVTARYPAVEAFVRRHGSAVQMHTAPSVDLLPKLKRAELDLAFLFAPLSTEDLVTHPVEEGPLVLLVPKGHDLARHEVIPIEAIEGQRILTYGRQHNRPLWDRQIGVLTDAGALLEEAPEPSLTAMFRTAPAAGLPSLTYPWTAQWLGEAMGMVTRRIQGDPCGYAVLLARRKGDLSPRAVSLWDAVVAASGDHQPSIGTSPGSMTTHAPRTDLPV